VVDDATRAGSVGRLAASSDASLHKKRGVIRGRWLACCCIMHPSPPVGLANEKGDFLTAGVALALAPPPKENGDFFAGAAALAPKEKSGAFAGAAV